LKEEHSEIFKWNNAKNILPYILISALLQFEQSEPCILCSFSKRTFDIQKSFSPLPMWFCI